MNTANCFIRWDRNAQKQKKKKSMGCLALTDSTFEKSPRQWRVLAYSRKQWCGKSQNVAELLHSCESVQF